MTLINMMVMVQPISIALQGQKGGGRRQESENLGTGGLGDWGKFLLAYLLVSPSLRHLVTRYSLLPISYFLFPISYFPYYPLPTTYYPF
jgi:hypothetical protein